jgi:N-acetylglutamate synthase-like GNAT family acetyltransferase
MAYVRRSATLEDCLELATRLREEDVKEVLASRPASSITEALHECVEVSYKNFSVIEEGVGCIAIFGVRESHLGGIPWMLTSDLLFEKSCRKFIRHCKEYAKELTEDFAYSFNYVSTTNTKAHHWLTWMGFTLDKTYTFNINGVSFHPFTYTRKSNV